MSYDVDRPMRAEQTMSATEQILSELESLADDLTKTNDYLAARFSMALRLTDPEPKLAADISSPEAPASDLVNRLRRLRGVLRRQIALMNRMAEESDL